MNEEIDQLKARLKITEKAVCKLVAIINDLQPEAHKKAIDKMMQQYLDDLGDL